MHFFLPVAVPKTRDIYILQEEVHFFQENFRFWNSLQVRLLHLTGLTWFALTDGHLDIHASNAAMYQFHS